MEKSKEDNNETVGVFGCGPFSLMSDLKRQIGELSSNYSAEIHFHEECFEL